MDKTFFTIGSICCGLAVGLGAFGAHALRARLDAADLAIFETGVRYQFYHGLALLVLALASQWLAKSSVTPWVGGLFCAGILLFSGSLYLLVLTNTRWLGAVTPLGGVCFLLGWAALAWAATS